MVTNGPGKFEGEPIYAAHFYGLYLDGMSDEFYDGDELVSAFDVTNEEHELFPDLEGVDVVLLWECSQGFVYTRGLTRAAYDDLRAEIESAELADSDEMSAYEELN